MARIVVAELEAKVVLNRADWQTGRAAVGRDIEQLSRQLDTLTARSAQVFSRTTAAVNQPSVVPNLTPQAVTQVQQATAATVQLGQAVKGLSDPVVQQARAMSQLESQVRAYIKVLGDSHPATAALRADLAALQSQSGANLSGLADPALATVRQISSLEAQVRSYTRTLGEAHPATAALRGRLEELRAASGATQTQVGGLTGAVQTLVQRFISGEGSATQFSRGVLQNLGGISLFAGGAVAAGVAVAGLVHGIAGLAEQGVAGNAAMEQFATTFEVILGSADAAKGRLQELARFAETTPFNLPEVVAADRLLQVFGGDALATGKNLRLVGDIAAGVNQPFGEVATWIGRMYDALQSGRPFGEASQRLQEMGALSGSGRARIEALAASGATFAQKWAAVNEETARFNGLMERQSHTFSGLASNVQDAFGAGLRTATAPLFDTLKAGLEGLASKETQAGIQATAEAIAKISDAAGSAGSAVGSLLGSLSRIPLAQATGSVLSFVGQQIGTGFGALGIAGSTIGNLVGSAGASSDKINAIIERQKRALNDLVNGTHTADEAVAASTGKITFSINTMASEVSRTAEGSAVVWVDMARASESAASQIATAWGTTIPDAFKRIKDDVAQSLPDVRGTIQQLLDLTDTVIDRAHERAAQFGTVTGTVQAAFSTELQEGLGVLSQWAAGNLDACSVAANKWGSTAPEIVGHIQSVRNELQKALDAAKDPAYWSWLNPPSTLSETEQQAQAARAATQALPPGTVPQGAGGVTPDDATLRAVQEARNQEALRRQNESAAAINAANAAAEAARKKEPASQVAEAVDQSKVQAAIDKAKATSKSYIDAQVAAQKAQNDARNALEKGLKAAGLIDQTTAEKEAARHTVTAIEFVQSQAQAAYNAIKSEIDTVTQLTTLRTPANLDAKLKEFASLSDKIIMGVQSVGARFGKADIEHLSGFADAGAKAAEFFNRQVTGLGELTKIRLPDQATIDRVIADGNHIVDKLGTAASRWKIEALGQLGVYADTGVKAAQFVQAATAALDSLRHAPKATVEAMDAFVTQFGQLTDRLKPLSTRYAPEIQQEMADFGERMSKALEGPQRGAELLKTLPEISAGVAAYIPPFFDNLDQVIVVFKQRASRWQSQVDDETVKLSRTISDELSGLTSAAQLFSTLANQRIDVRGQVNLFFDNLSQAVKLFAAYSVHWRVQASDDIAKIATNVGTVMDGINKALDPIIKFGDAAMVGDYEINLAFQNIRASLAQFSKLADTPMLQGASLARLQAASNTIGSVFSGLKLATDTLLNLQTVADDTGTIDLGASLDTFFLSAIPSYADSFETAMDRIGTSAEGAGRRIASAFGVMPSIPAPNAPRVGAGADAVTATAPARLAAPASGVTNYYLNINGLGVATNARIKGLISEIVSHTDLMNGGVPVGVT